MRLEGVTGRLDAVEAITPGGRRLRGARAIAEALWTLGGVWRGAALVCRLPGAELGYRLVTRIRGHLPGDPT